MRKKGKRKIQRYPTKIKPPADCRCRGAQMYYVSNTDVRLTARMPEAFLGQKIISLLYF